MNLKLSVGIREKLLTRYDVREHEIHECFANRTHGFLVDDREEHKTDPRTHWFISETDYGRELKIIFVPRKNSDNELEIHIKSAYDANKKHIKIYADKFKNA